MFTKLSIIVSPKRICNKLLIMVNAIETASVTPVFRKVAECLYRHARTGTYYGLVKKSGRQFRKSYKTTERKLAERSLAEFRQKVGRLTRHDNLGKVTFAELAAAWIAVHRTKLKRNSSDRLDAGIKQLNRFFGTLSVRGITETELREWKRRYSSEVSASWFNMQRLILQNVLIRAVREGLWFLATFSGCIGKVC